MSDHTDPGHVTGSHERTSRAGTRVGDSGSPVGSPLTIVLAVIAVAVGFLIFRSISDGDANGGALPGATTLPAGATVAPGQTTVAGGTAGPTTPTTQAAETRSGATVIVANASSQGGVAAAMSDQLAELGYTMGEPTSDLAEEGLEASIVYYSVGNETIAVAQTLARDMGGIEIQEMPSPIPVESLGDGSVVLMLGNDYAGQDVPGPPPQAPAAPTNPTTTSG